MNSKFMLYLMVLSCMGPSTINAISSNTLNVSTIISTSTTTITKMSSNKINSTTNTNTVVINQTSVNIENMTMATMAFNTDSKLIRASASTKLTKYSSTLAKSTTTTTKSPKQLRNEECDSYRYWKFPKCISLCLRSCVQNFLYKINEYFKCRDERNGEQPSLRFSKEPMLLTFYVNEFTKYLTTREFYSYCQVRTFHIYDRFMWYARVGKRLSDLVLPNYKGKVFKRTNGRWNRKNDSITIPYGNILRGVFHLQFAMYEEIISEKVVYDKENFRLKEVWPSGNHPILTSQYISLRSENDWLFKPNHVINSIIMTAVMQPSHKLILPTYNTIAFTHRNRKLTNPICVYWQPVTSGTPGKGPKSGYWTNNHMEVYKTNKSMTICRTYTFGTYAVFMEPHPKPPVEYINKQHIVFNTLLLVSALVPFVYIAGMFLLRCHKSTANRMYIYMAFSLLMSQALTLASFFYRDNWQKCTAFTGWIQFFYVSFICWLFMESIHRLDCILFLFNRQTNQDLMYHMLGIGFPVSNVIAMQGFPYDKFNELPYCWIYTTNQKIGYWLSPIILLLAAILIVKIVTWKEIKKDKALENDFAYEEAHLSFMATIAVIPTLMGGWCMMSIGVQMSGIMHDLTLICAPILHILVGLQMLYFYFYRNYWVIKAFTEEYRIRELQKLNTFSFLEDVPLQVLYKAGKYDCLEEEENEEEEERGMVIESSTTSLSADLLTFD